MAKVMIVPASDYEILKKYLDPAVVLIPETILSSFPPEAQKKALELSEDGAYYDFGGEPGINMDVILCKDSYAYNKLLQTEDKDEEGGEYYFRM